MGEFPFYSFKPKPLRGLAHAVSCTTPRGRYAGRLNSGVRHHEVTDWMADIFQSDWEGMARILIVGVLSYVILIVFLRLSGKRTLSKMNAFDLIVNISLGSILATILLNDSVPLTHGLLAFGVLIALQFAVTWSSVRVPWIRRFVTGEPALVLHQGSFLPAALKRARVTQDEVRAAVRSAGLCDLGMVAAVVIETDGSFSVVRKSEGSGASSLTDVKDHSSSDVDAA